MKIVVAITAASGQIYARRIVDMLVQSAAVSEVALIYSQEARGVAEAEGAQIEISDKITIYDNKNLYAPMASGSAKWDTMVVVPCSAGTLSRIAHGTSDSLITRSADVMLKERRRLVLVLREAPLSLIHLRNMVSLTEAGAVIYPASPSFYGGESSVEQIIDSVCSRVVSLLGVDGYVREWGGEKNI